jgi:hypothetical protein
MATPERFELPTYGIEIHCSIQLSYGAGAAGENLGAGELYHKSAGWPVDGFDGGSLPQAGCGLRTGS